MIKEKKKRKTKVNCKTKGSSFERKIANLFKKHWGVVAYRTPSSGAYTSRNVSQALKDATVGDVVIEELPELVIECKNYYSLHFTSWFKESPQKESIWSFWCKLKKEAEEFNKIPLLICKEENSPIVVISDIDIANVFIDYAGCWNNFFSMSKDGEHLIVFDLNSILELDIEQIELIIKDIVNKIENMTYTRRDDE